MPEYNRYDSFGFLLYRTARAMAGFFNNKLTESGFTLTVEQWGLLVLLSENDGINQRDISLHTCKDKTFVTRMIDQLEKGGLVVRKENKSDRRNRRIHLTAKGRKTKDQLIPFVKENILGEASRNFSASEMITFKNLLNKLYDNINEQHTIT
jgi:MarR family transcriptional regulator, organic hydroperoxide resistance regulator